MRKLILPIILLLIVVFVVTAFKTIPVLRQSIPGRIVRFCLGEPGATQGVNDAADKIISSGWDKELIKLSDQLMEEYSSFAFTLPKEIFAQGHSLPLYRLPQKFRSLGYGKLDFVLQLDDTYTPTALVLSWRHMRHGIIIYAHPPRIPPTGFFVRKVNERIYVVANKS